MHNTTPGFCHHEEVRRLFRMNETTLAKWCRAGGYDLATARRALKGEQNRPLSYEVRRHARETIASFRYLDDEAA